MATSAYVGLPGSGKSFTVVKSVILPALMDGLNVWTNIPMKMDVLTRDNISLPTQFDIKDIFANPNWFDDVLPKGVLLVIDEVQLLWPAGLKQNNANQKHIEFLTKHRHLVGDNGKSTEIVLLTQRLSLVSNFVRGIIEKSLMTNNLEVIGKPKSYRIDIYADAVPDRPNKKNKIRDVFGKYDPKIYQYYISHTDSDGGAGNEKRIDNRLNLFGGWAFKSFIIFFVLLISLFFFLADSFLSNSSLFNSEEEIEANQSPVIDTANVSSSPNISQSPQVQQVVKKKVQTHFLEKIQDIYISLNMGKFPKIDYQVTVSFMNNETVLNSNTLTLLGYKIQRINECLIVLHRDDFKQYVGCRKDRNDSGTDLMLGSAIASFN